MDSLERAMQLADGYTGSTPASVKRAITNEKQGVGSDNDVVNNTTIVARYFTRRLLETVYRTFSLAAKVVDLKPDDVFSPGIVWNGEEESNVEKMRMEMERLRVMKKIPEAVKAARLYGTAVAILAPMDGRLEEPMDPDGVKEGEISHILVADRYALTEVSTYGDPRQEKFGQAHTYRWDFRAVTGEWRTANDMPRNYESFVDVHATRCLRFDGIPPLGDDGWHFNGDDRWGLSVLSRVLDDIIQDQVQNAALQDLIKRSAIPVFKVSKYRDFLGRGASRGDPTPQDYMQQFADDLQSSLAVFIDKNDEVDKIDVHSQGVQDIVDALKNRIAMLEGIPITRFTGESATGLSATGNGDARDWRITLEAYRKRAIDSQWNMLLNIVANNAGLSEVPEWEWGELGETTEMERAEISKARADTVKMLLEAGAINETEGREYMNKGEDFELSKDFDPPEIEMPMPNQGAAGGNNDQGQRR